MKAGDIINKREKEIIQAQLDNEKEVLKKIENNYKDALSEINSKIEILLARKDADLQHVIYQVEYQKALKTQVEAILDTLHNNEFETVSQYLTKSYEEGFISTMYDLQSQGIPLIMPIDQEQVAVAIQHETKLSESLYAALGKDTKVLSKQIAGEISRGIAGAQMYEEIARNIAGYAGIGKNNAMRIARTEAHRIQNKATADAQWKAKEKGAEIVKIWSAALDGKTRDTHRQLDGQIRELDEPFEVDGMEAMQPGDFGIPEEDINCRCRCNSRARWLLDEPYTKWDENAPVLISDDGTTQYSKIEAKNYEDFKKQYNQASERVIDRESKAQVTSIKEKSISEAEESTKNILADAYEYHRTSNNLNATPYKEGLVSVNYGKIDEKCASYFDSTFADLTSKYDTTLQSVRIMTKDEYVFNKNSFAFTNHNYEVDKSTLVINPAKFKDYDLYVERMKELMSNGYAVNVGDDNAGKYIATHEFAHTLIDTGSTLDKKRNWLGADYKKIQSARNEIESVYKDYLDAVNILSENQKKAELEALSTFSDEAWKNAQSINEKLLNVRISRYSLENADEFLAESFTAEQFGVGNEWSKKVTDIIDSYFKK